MISIEACVWFHNSKKILEYDPKNHMIRPLVNLRGEIKTRIILNNEAQTNEAEFSNRNFGSNLLYWGLMDNFCSSFLLIFLRERNDSSGSYIIYFRIP